MIETFLLFHLPLFSFSTFLRCPCRAISLKTKASHTLGFSYLRDSVPIELTCLFVCFLFPVKWISIKGTVCLYMQRRTLAAAPHTVNISQQGVYRQIDRGVWNSVQRSVARLVILKCVIGILSLKPCFFFVCCCCFFLRWLLPPQALNAYYLPNKNQMGKYVTLHWAYYFLSVTDKHTNTRTNKIPLLFPFSTTTRTIH